MPANFVQSSVAANARKGIPGMPFSADPRDYKVVTRIATVAIPFNSYVAFDGEFCFIPSSAQHVAGREGGVAIRSHVQASEAGYAVGDPVPVMVQGDVWVNHNNVATAMDRVYVRTSNPSGGSGAVGEYVSNATFAAYAPNLRVAQNNGGAALGAVPTGITLLRVGGVNDGYPTGSAGA